MDLLVVLPLVENSCGNLQWLKCQAAYLRRIMLKLYHFLHEGQLTQKMLFKSFIDVNMYSVPVIKLLASKVFLKTSQLNDPCGSFVVTVGSKVLFVSPYINDKITGEKRLFKSR